MILGTVRHSSGRVRPKVKGPRIELEFDCIVDTGYTGDLTLPSMAISRLRLAWRGFDRCVLADGSICTFDVFDSQANWDGKYQPILVEEAEGVPLVGMRLLAGYELRMRVCDGGKVIIKRMRR